MFWQIHPDHRASFEAGGTKRRFRYGSAHSATAQRVSGSTKRQQKTNKTHGKATKKSGKKLDENHSSIEGHHIYHHYFHGDESMFTSPITHQMATSSNSTSGTASPIRFEPNGASIFPTYTPLPYNYPMVKTNQLPSFNTLAMSPINPSFSPMAHFNPAIPQHHGFSQNIPLASPEISSSCKYQIPKCSTLLKALPKPEHNTSSSPWFNGGKVNLPMSPLPKPHSVGPCFQNVTEDNDGACSSATASLTSSPVLTANAAALPIDSTTTSLSAFSPHGPIPSEPRQSLHTSNAGICGEGGYLGSFTGKNVPRFPADPPPTSMSEVTHSHGVASSGVGTNGNISHLLNLPMPNESTMESSMLLQNVTTQK